MEDWFILFFSYCGVLLPSRNWIMAEQNKKEYKNFSLVCVNLSHILLPEMIHDGSKISMKIVYHFNGKTNMNSVFEIN